MKLEAFHIGLLSASAFMALIAGGAAVYSYVWWTAYNQGADSAICVYEIGLDGKNIALSSRACRAVENLDPPKDVWGLRDR